MRTVWMIACLLSMTALVHAVDATNTGIRTTVTRKAIQQERILPAKLVMKKPGHLFADFGKAAFAGLEIEIPAPEAGRELVVHMGEAVSGPDTVHRTPGGSVRYWSTRLTLRADQRRYTVPLKDADGRLMSQAIGPVMPFRYVEIENAPRLEKNHIRQIAAFYPFDSQASDFRCADVRLNAIWEMCKYTMRATSFGGVFIDGDRERLPYEADAYINQLGWYCCTDDVTLPRYSHEYLILKPTWPTEWILFSVLMAWEDYRYTGDPASLKEFYSDLKDKTLIALARPDGLISTVEPPFPEAVGKTIHIKKIRDIVDWPAGERDSHEMRPINTVVNAFHAHALRRMADIAAVLNKPDDARHFQEAAARVVKSIHEKLFDPATGLYIDGEGSHHSSLHANMFPLAFGLVPPDRREKVVAFLQSRGMACSVYGAQFLLDALFDNGCADYALALMTADNDRSFTHMIDRVGSTIALEAWDAKYKPNLDWNHAWGAAPANILPRKVLGIEPLAPGFEKIQIQPRPGSLRWAEGHVPARGKRVAVRWDQDDTTFRLRVEIPSGATARVGVPMGANGQIQVDGKTIRGVESEGSLFVDNIGAGKHTLVVLK